ncbi:MAG TPA: hypothetical protein VMB75_05850 [Rhodocyclaceae bacterium]|nr:hypothetical protein [Rhodocyclaceae bacterium]
MNRCLLAGVVLAILVETPIPSARAGESFSSAVAPERNSAIVGLAPPSLADQLQEARAQLTQARRLRDESAGQRGGEVQGPPTASKLRLLDWLVDLRSEKIERLEELAALQGTPKFKADDDPLVRALESASPNSALQIDALRDEIDGLKESLAAAEASLRANRAELQNLQDQLKDRDAAARRAGDRPPGADPAVGAMEVKEKWEIADLRHLTTETELAVAALAQQSLKLRIGALSSRIADLEAVVARALAGQQLSLDGLTTQRQRVAAERDRLAAESISASRRYAQHRAERERLDAGRHPVGGASNQQAALLELAIKTDNVVLKGLDDLQVLTGVAGDAWQQRYVVLSGTDSEQRRAALATLTELQKELADRRSSALARQETLRTEVRQQRMRIGSVDQGGKAPGPETARLDLLLQQAAMDERVELAATRLERQVSRWLADFPDAGGQGLEARAAWLGDRAADLLTRVWQQELFVAEDVSEVDGRRLSVQHSVTVGKSIGILIVFALGYWLLSRLSRFVQHQLVRRLKVGRQLASVVRRWAMSHDGLSRVRSADLELRDTLGGVGRAAAVHELAELPERRPEALLGGKRRRR